jgi:ribose transport system substrate-binding protein
VAFGHSTGTVHRNNDSFLATDSTESVAKGQEFSYILFCFCFCQKKSERSFSMKKMKLWFIALLVGMVGLAGCSLQSPGSVGPETGKKSGPYTIGLSLSTLNNPFFVSLKEGAEKKAKALGMNVITVDAQNNSAKQANDIEDLIQKHVDLIIINPTDSNAVVSAIQAANDAKIPVITVDRAANGGKVVSHIASDNVAGGKMAGQYLLSLVGKGANVVELEGIPGSSAARERGQGFEETVKGQLNIVSKQTANFDRAQGLSVMENILQGNKNIKGVFAQNDEMALGALEALKAAGLKDVKVVGFDGTQDAVAAIKRGEMAGTVAQQPTVMGEKAIETAKQYLEGKNVNSKIPVSLDLIKQ